jgi:hypothetical protein
MSSTHCFSSRIPYSAVALALLIAAQAFAQNAFVRITAPGVTVLAGAQLQLAGSITNVAGTPMDASALAWTSSDSTLGSVSAGGLVQGIMPGDITVTAADSVSGASASILIHVVPLAIKVQPPTLTLTAGSTTPISAQALDAGGSALAGVQFQFRSGQPSVADVAADGTVSGIAEGFVTIEARIASVTSNAALVATIPVHVTPKPPYRIKKILSTETGAPSAVAAYSVVSAVSAGEIAAIATLANGSQAALLIENGKQKLLAVTGRTLPNAGRMVMRMDGISANANGDVVLHIEYPAQWCSSSMILFPHGQPEQEIDAGPCFANLNPRALAADGTFLYRNGDQILRADAVHGSRLLFSMATQPTLQDPIRSVNDFYPSRAGTFILNTNTASGAHQYFYFDGKSLTPIFKDGDRISAYPGTLSGITGSSDGKFYGGLYGAGYSGLVQLAPGPAQMLVMSQNQVPGGTFGWVQNIADAGPSGVLMTSDLSLGSYATWLVLWNGTGVSPLVQTAGYASMVAGALLPSGTGIASVLLPGDTSLPLRSFSAGNNPGSVQGTGQVTDAVPPGIDWHYAAHGGSDTAIPARGAGDALVKAGDTLQTLAATGSTLPNGKLALTMGAVSGNESGDVLFTAGFVNGSGMFRYRGSTLETLADSTVAGTGPSGTSLSWADTYRGRYLALNNHGQYAAIAAYNSAKRVVFYGSGTPVQIAQASAGGYTNLQSVAIDDNGRVMFVATTADGRVAAYYWDGKTVQRVIGTGDAGAPGLTVNELSNIAGSGSGFLIVLASGNYANRELRFWDGSQLTVIQSTDTTMFDGIGLSWYWMNECTLAANGDAHCMAGTQDSGTGIFAHRPGRGDLVVARSRDSFPAGEWMIVPLSVSSSASGAVYFTAYMYKDGNEFLALYQATPQ